MITIDGGYNRSLVTNGDKWRPDYETASEDGSDKMPATGAKYILLREDSTSSAYNFNFHYNTLRAIDHPHALTMAGFGESSTDLTLPRTIKHRVEGPHSPLAETQFNSPVSNGMVNGGFSLSYPTIHESDDINDNRLNKSDMYFNNHNGGGDSGRGSSESGPPSPGEGDRRSVTVITLDPSALDNPVFDDDVEENGVTITEKIIPQPEVPDLDNSKYDSLLSKKDLNLFSYDNAAMEPASKETATPLGPNTPFTPVVEPAVDPLLAPPREFQDVDPPVAIVSPSVIKQNGGAWLLGNANPLTAQSKPPAAKNGVAHPPRDSKPAPSTVGNAPVHLTSHLEPSRSSSAQKKPTTANSPPRQDSNHLEPQKSFLHQNPKPSASVAPNVKKESVRL